MNITELIADMQLHFPASSPKEVAKALLAQQETILQQQRVIEQMWEALAGMEKWASKVHDGYPKTTASMYAEPFRKAAQKALALQPDLSALREHDVEVVKAFVDALATYEKDPQQFVIEYIERIRKGE